MILPDECSVTNQMDYTFTTLVKEGEVQFQLWTPAEEHGNNFEWFLMFLHSKLDHKIRECVRIYFLEKANVVMGQVISVLMQQVT